MSGYHASSFCIENLQCSSIESVRTLLCLPDTDNPQLAVLRQRPDEMKSDALARRSMEVQPVHDGNIDEIMRGQASIPFGFEIV